jgi:Uma2 family endonuclease
MASPQTITYITPQEYLDGERISEFKNELIDGQIYMMAGTSVNHDRIAGNLYKKTSFHLERSHCESFSSDVKLKVDDNFYYPDVMVVCNDPEEDDHYRTAPVIIVEVLSSSTRQYDRTIKKHEYLSIPSLKEYVLVEQDFVDVEVFRKDNGWQSDHYFLGDSLTLDSIGLVLTVEEIYHRVQNQDMHEFLAKNNK